MARTRSLFDQSLDRSVFVTYFLGSVVPLVALAVLTERLLPTLAGRDAQIAAIGLVIAVCVLSLVSFFALRRIVTTTLKSMNAYNERLERLLAVSRELGDAPHAQVVLETAANCATVLCQADATWLFTRGGPEKTFQASSTSGSDGAAWLERYEEEWLGLMESTVVSGQRIVIEAGPETPALVVMPFVGEVAEKGVIVALRSGASFGTAELDSLSALVAQASVALISADLRDAQRNFFSHMTDMVVAALDAHVAYREGHSNKVARTANRVGRAMGLDDDALHNLHFAALLHDVGMLRIPTEHQRNPIYFRRHATIGHKMLSRIKLWENVAPIVLQHHERPDGAGYPEGLLADDICMEARILGVCDAWDAMRAPDHNRAALTLEGALGELQRNCDTQFDGEVVAAMSELIQAGEID